MQKLEKLIRPVICIGLEGEKQIALIPFMCVDFFTIGGRSKRIFINWTYGSPANPETENKRVRLGEVKFKNDLGKMKLLQLQRLEIDGEVEVRLMLESERGRSFSERIKEVIENAQDGSRVLFVIPEEVDDSEFYSALSIFIDPSGEVTMVEENMGNPIFSLKELGVSIGEPFIEVDPRGM